MEGGFWTERDVEKRRERERQSFGKEKPAKRIREATNHRALV